MYVLILDCEFGAGRESPTSVLGETKACQACLPVKHDFTPL